MTTGIAIAKTQALAAAFPFNPDKAAEIGDAARTPVPRATAEPSDSSVVASPLTELHGSTKTGARAQPGVTGARN